MVRPITEEDLGLRVLYDGTDGASRPEAGGLVDIVTVHGIGAHPDDTWCKKIDGDDGRTRTDLLFLSGTVLVASLSEGTCSAISAAHGTNMSQVLVDAHMERKRWPGIYDSTGEILKHAYKLFTGSPVYGENLGILQAGGVSLIGLVDTYLRIARQSAMPRVACFYEQKASDVGRIFGKNPIKRRKIPSVILVNENSGSLDLNEKSDKYALPRTHFDIEKFGSPEEQGFRLVRPAIITMVEEGHDLVFTRVNCAESKNGRRVTNLIISDARAEECIKDLCVTDPRDDMIRIEQTKGGLLTDAYRWILDNNEFRQWCDDADSRLLWIKGDPSKGKTMLLCGIIDELEKSIGKTGLLSFFFCQASDSRISNVIAVLRGLMLLLAKQQPSLVPHILERYKEAAMLATEPI
ncbi:hypothetical protein DL770_007209 [Monosporascus sp. CRB-9-2]|nr:hypothetical protein DL770_007209 [Monosporascus sp. CRB-9-2]